MVLRRQKGGRDRREIAIAIWDSGEKEGSFFRCEINERERERVRESG